MINIKEITNDFPLNFEVVQNKLEFITDPGYLDGYDSRVKAGYPPDTGP